MPCEINRTALNNFVKSPSNQKWILDSIMQQNRESKQTVHFQGSHPKIIVINLVSDLTESVTESARPTVMESNNEQKSVGAGCRVRLTNLWMFCTSLCFIFGNVMDRSLTSNMVGKKH